MKKALILFSIMTVLYSSVQAQLFTFGPLVNGKYSWTSTNREATSKAIPAFSAGGFARLKLLKLYVQPEMSYTQNRGGNFSYSTFSGEFVEKVRFRSVDANLLLGLQLFQVDKGLIGLHLNTGPGACFIMDKSLKVNGEEIPENEYKDYILTWQAGGGLDLGRSLMIDLRYELGLNNIMTDRDPSLSTRAIMVQVAYKIIHRRSEDRGNNNNSASPTDE